MPPKNKRRAVSPMAEKMPVENCKKTKTAGRDIYIKVKHALPKWRRRIFGPY
jgi:hypothetical protein